MAYQYHERSRWRSFFRYAVAVPLLSLSDAETGPAIHFGGGPIIMGQFPGGMPSSGGHGGAHPHPVTINFQFGNPGMRREAFNPLSLMLGNMRQIAQQQAMQVSSGNAAAVDKARQLAMGSGPGLMMPGGGMPFGGGVMLPLPMQVASIFNALGDASGSLGEASHFQIQDTEGGMRISAHLPGHQLGTEGAHPLQVRVVGRTLVVKGTHVNPPIMTEFQRSFHLPRRVAVSKVKVDYSTSSGKLLITLPPRLLSEDEAGEGTNSVEQKDEQSAQRESPFADIEENMRRFFEDSSRMVPGQPKSGFLTKPAKGPDHEEVLSLFDQLVVKAHEHETVEGRADEDNTTYLGCFAESELPGDRSRVPEIGTYVEMKARAEGGPAESVEVEVEFFNLAPEPMQVWLYQGNNERQKLEDLAAASGLRPGPDSAKRVSAKGGDTLLWVSAANDTVMQRVPIFPGRILSVYTGNVTSNTSVDINSGLASGRNTHFAIARSLGHHLQQGHEWTLSGQGAGYVFSDPPHMPPKFGMAECGMRCLDGEHWCGCDPAASDIDIFTCPGNERRFAIYALPNENGTSAEPPRSRAVWHLGEDADGAPTLEVHAPPGRELKQEGGRLFVVPASAVSSDSLDSTSSEALAATSIEQEKEDGSLNSISDTAEPVKQDLEPLASVGVPLDLSDHECAVSEDRSAMKCRLPEDHVKEVPITYTNDEL